jgi:uncharacterized protein
MLRIDIAALAEGLHAQTLRVDPAALDLDPALFGEAVLDLRLDVAGRRILAAFDVHSVATLECDRTLVEYRQRVGGHHTILFLPPEQIPTGAVDGADEDVLPLPDEATEIDLTGPVRDTLLLALPLRRVAPEAEDAEIPTAFGVETDEEGRPIDDRWDALRRLRDTLRDGDRP